EAPVSAARSNHVSLATASSEVNSLSPKPIWSGCGAATVAQGATSAAIAITRAAPRPRRRRWPRRSGGAAIGLTKRSRGRPDQHHRLTGNRSRQNRVGADVTAIVDPDVREDPRAGADRHVVADHRPPGDRRAALNRAAAAEPGRFGDDDAGGVIDA